MKNEEKDALFQELLEYHYGCHPDPERIEVRLGEDPEAQALLEDARRTAATLSEAAHEPGLGLKLALPTPAPGRRSSPWGRRLRVAASILVALALLGPMAHWGYRAWEQKRLESEQVRLVVSGPPSYPAGTAGRFRIETWDPGNQPRLATVSWRVLDKGGAVLEERTEPCDGTLELALTPRLEGAACLEVEAEAGGTTVATVFNLGQDKTPPLVHLSTDKPAYRPGETAFLRAAILDRLTLQPRTGTYWLRVIDAKGSPVMQTTAPAQEGVAALEWNIPESASGGRYVFEVRDGTNAFTVESLELLVRRFQPPRLAKKLDLDRETYAPGERGSAEIEVSRLGGGVPAGAPVQATLLVDGEKVWEKAGHLDAEGRAIMSFVVPEKVERGAGRFVAKITDGGVVETEIEPFVIPTGRLEVAFHPEGGELVAGVRNRVYVEITDPLDRPASATGRIVDADGREVARLHTLHQGRGRIELIPEAGATYRLEFDEPKAPATPLPGARPSGVVLRAEGDFTPAGAPLRVGVHTPGSGPWIVGVFCRGSLVAQDTFSGAGEHALGLDLPGTVAGVLRVTVFDASLKPLAERLVHRESGRRLQVALEPKSPVAAPGEKQEIEILVTDETGKPVRTVLGLTVTDRAVRDMLDEHRVGIEDQAWLVADVEDLEDIEEFVAGDDESRRNIDLVLGNRGWRRFAWVDPVAFVAEHGDKGKALLLREGHAQVPVVSDTGIRHGRLLTEARRETREAKEVALSILAIVLAAGGLFLVGSLLWMLSGVFIRRGGLIRTAGRSGVVAAGLVLVVLALQVPLRRSRLAPGLVADDARVYAVAERAALPAPDAGALEAPGLEATGVVDVLALHLAEGVDFGAPVRLADINADAARGVVVRAPFDQLGVIAGDDQAEPGAPEGDAPVAAEAAAREAPAGEPLPWDPVAQPNPVAPEAAEEIADLEEEAVVVDPMVGFIAHTRVHRYYTYTRIYAHQRKPGAARDDFTETVYWNAALVTDAEGKARVAFDLSDSVTTWSIHADAHGGGRIGQESASFETRVPFQMEAVIPAEVSDGDRLQLPVALTAYPDIVKARIGVSAEGALRIDGDAKTLNADLEQGRGRVLVPLVVDAAGEPSRIFLSGNAAGWRDRVTRQVRVVPRGFPRHLSQSGVVTDSVSHVLPVPARIGAGSLGLVIKLYPSPLATLVDGMDGMLRQPGGCFEQASSSNYPNVLALLPRRRSARTPRRWRPAPGSCSTAATRKIAGLRVQRARLRVVRRRPGPRGAHRLRPARVPRHGQGLPRWTRRWSQRTRDWLMERRDGKGGFQRNAKALDSFGRAPQPIGRCLRHLRAGGHRRQPARSWSSSTTSQTRARRERRSLRGGAGRRRAAPPRAARTPPTGRATGSRPCSAKTAGSWEPPPASRLRAAPTSRSRPPASRSSPGSRTPPTRLTSSARCAS